MPTDKVNSHDFDNVARTHRILQFLSHTPRAYSLPEQGKNVRRIFTRKKMKDVGRRTFSPLWLAKRKRRSNCTRDKGNARVKCPLNDKLRVLCRVGGSSIVQIRAEITWQWRHRITFRDMIAQLIVTNSTYIDVLLVWLFTGLLPFAIFSLRLDFFDEFLLLCLELMKF